MREFDEIGRTIEEFASEDATVVIGTSLDTDMQDEVRVTVVATGLNRGAVRQTVRSSEREPVIQQRPVKLVRNATTGAIENPGAFNPGLTGHGLRPTGRTEAACPTARETTG